MFKIGDVVEMTAEAAATGMLDFVEGGSYKVEKIGSDRQGSEYVFVINESSRGYWYTSEHFKLKENSVESNENHFKVGQTVWDVVYGEGEVVNVLQNVINYPIVVKFVDGKRYFTEDGKFDTAQSNRSLFFSEPKVIAETKPAFVPILKEGDTVFAVARHPDISGETGRILVDRETEDAVWDSNYNTGWLKTHWEFYKLGEKIEFN